VIVALGGCIPRRNPDKTAGMAGRQRSKCSAVLIRIAATLTIAVAARAQTTPVAATAAPPRSTPAAADMVEVAAGPFLMGCNAAVDSQCFDNEAAGHQVEVAAFRIDRTEVTVEQYARCVRAGACSTTGLTMPSLQGIEQKNWASFCNWGQPGRERHPINCLDWEQAKAYCAWTGARLPTEVEWEKAARGSDGRKYSWGNDGFVAGHPVANISDESAKRVYPKWTIAVGYDDGWVGTAPVGSFPAGASPYGALDMIGNVWEWLADEAPGGRAARGGCWSAPPYVRVSTRNAYDPRGHYHGVGVRCAK
jgi:formylglycine-generating enzyme required for sulfatase activity